ncbi:asparagine synthase (glutamine-hydrolyzing) [Fulvivirga lutimaris]|uniref:asparagine synthase (glutamine-hydrolyzing) n=1 Tax=Fulvivirga lutimaris TaxID=1819566 RepID=UPI0012BD34DC|nr:asparagine synthase (glutamine-hydrolyzing) [Fulvivirga lutimaris]MTI38308.1 asparagine synthase (glutamine-hydrolyzing) [Fulvivirga lutimaris]
MCGIAGFLDRNCNSSKEILINMTNSLENRGPDDHGHVVIESDSYQVGLGHRRLSIIDLSQFGHQPYTFEHLQLVFNGEIYNYMEVREQLTKVGYSFQSTSDTEVIIKNIHYKGLKNALADFIGMFAFALFDSSTEKLFLTRDRAGVKPLYYYHKDKMLLFASELKAFHQSPRFEKALNTDALSLYFTYSYIPVPHTIFQNAYKLEPGHYLEVSVSTGELKKEKYWDIFDAYNKPKLNIDYEEAKEELTKLMLDSFQLRMVADVPVGIFLSGGYDSTAVAALLQQNSSSKLKTFTIGFEDKGFDEAPYARKVADYLGTEHHEHYCTYKDARDIIPKIPEIFDEPFGDNSVIPTLLVSQMAVKEVKVALSADGGDELFCGYPKFTNALKYTGKIPKTLQKAASGVMSMVNPQVFPRKKETYNFDQRYLKMQEIWQNQDPVEAMITISKFNVKSTIDDWILAEHKDAISYFKSSNSLNRENDAINKMLAIDYKTFLLDNNLTKVDRCTMSVSLEGREPFLDHRLNEMIAQLPSSYKYHDGVTKRILKDIVHNAVPKNLMERPKMGFVVPIMDWFKNDLKEITTNYLSDEKLKQDDLLNYKQIGKLRDSYLNGTAENVQRIWHLLVFQMWREKWM